MTSIDDYCNYIARPDTAALIGAISTQVLNPSIANQTVRLASMDVPVWVFSAAACALGNVIGTVTNAYVAPHVTTLTLLNAPAHTALTIGISAGSTALAYHTLVGPGWNDGVSAKSIIAIATLSEIGSSYLTETWIKPSMTQYLN